MIQDKTKFVKVGDLDLPITTDLFKWGKIFAQDDNVIKIVKSHSRIIYVVEKSETFNYVKIMIGKIVFLQFFDYPNPDKNLDTTFRRVIGVVEGKQSTYVFFEGKRIFFKNLKVIKQ